LSDKFAQLLVAQTLVMKHQHGVAIDRLPQRLHTRPVDRPGEIHTADFADKKRMQLANFDAHAFFPRYRGDNRPAYRSSQLTGGHQVVCWPVR
jgi:hypothetical protein